MTTLISFDPGQKGGIAWYKFGAVGASVMPLAGSELDLGVIADLVKKVQPNIAVIEKVHSLPGNGAKSMFCFGRGYGSLLGICTALDVRVELVTPQTWKREVLKGTKKDKDAAIAYCRRAYPKLSLLPTEKYQKPHDGMADAVCLLDYGRRKFIGVLEEVA